MILAMALLAAQAQGTDPLAPAANGAMQCYTPNVSAKTCRSMASYTRNPDGSYRNVATVLLATDNDFTLELATTVTVRAGAVCGTIKREDLMGGTLRINGQMLPADQAAPLLTRIAAGFDSIGMLESEICTRYTPDGDGLKAEATLNGTPRPDTAQHVIWVTPGEGYKVAPGG